MICMLVDEIYDSHENGCNYKEDEQNEKTLVDSRATNAPAP